MAHAARITEVQVNRPAILAQMRAGTLSETEHEELCEQGIITPDMIEMINKEGQAAAQPACGLSSSTAYECHSEILLNSFAWKGNSLATAFLKARDGVIKNKHPQLLEERKQVSRLARNALCNFLGNTGIELDADGIVENYAGFGRVWTTPEKKIASIAEEHGISLERARELSEAGAAAAQDYVQRQRGNLCGIYLGWLADVTPCEDAEDEGLSQVAIGECITQAYARAGEWTNRPEGLLIEDAAEYFGIMLPKWADVLPTITQKTKQQREAVERRIALQVEAATNMYIEAQKALGNDW